RHGMTYDAARQAGCVVCRREAGELAAEPSARPDWRPFIVVGILLGVVLVGGVFARAAMRLLEKPSAPGLAERGPQLERLEPTPAVEQVDARELERERRRAEVRSRREAERADREA